MKRNNYILVALFGVMAIVLSCSKSEGTYTNNKAELELVNSFSINVSEPSGLAINVNGTELFTVSDNTNNIYKLSVTGAILKEFQFAGNDLEGISTYTNGKLLISEERTKEIIEFDINTENFTKHFIDYKNKEENSGIEGVCYNSNNKTIYILNEKNPGLLIQLDTSFSIISSVELKFASDYSGIFYDASLNVLWIVSDQSKTLNKCKLNGDLIKEYQLKVTKAEGVAVTNNKIYVVSDSENKLFIYNKPTE